MKLEYETGSNITYLKEDDGTMHIFVDHDEPFDIDSMIKTLEEIKQEGAKR